MAIFDTNKKRYLTYYIVLPDAAQVAAFQAQYPVGTNRAITETRPTVFGIPLGPVPAATQYGAPFRGYTDPNAGAPYTWTPFYSANPAAPDSKPFPTNWYRFSRHSGGFLGIGGTTITYYWIGQFVLPGQIATTGTEGNIPRRYWIEGFETPLSGVTASGDGSMGASRDASRHVGGVGMAMRGVTGASAGITPLLIDTTVTNVFKSWERIYVRLRKAPSATPVEFWHMEMDGSDGNSAGLSLQVLPSAQVKVVHRRFSGNVDLGTIGPLPIWTGASTDNAWVRLDILMNMRGNGNIDPGGRARVYMRGVLACDFVIAAASAGLACSNGRVNSSKIGNSLAVANDMEMDLDDWHSAAIPGTDGGAGGTEALTSLDWKLGSKIVRLRGTALSSASAGWTGGAADFRITRQQPLTNTVVNAEASITSIVSGALLELDCDNEVVTKDPGAFSAVAFTAVQVQKAGLRAGVADGTCGYRLGANAAVDTAIVEDVTKEVNDRALYTVPGTANTFPTGTTPIRLRHTKAASIDLATVYSLSAQVEIVGRWGKEDHRLADQGGVELPVYRREPGPHNAPYPLVPWALGSPVANASAPVIFHTGTYVGNGTGQDLVFRAPVAWIYIRTDAGTNAGLWFNTAGVIQRFGLTTGATTQPHDAIEDLTFVPGSGEDTQMQRYMVRLSGVHAQVNQLGVTYRYLAVMDPGARYFLNACATVLSGATHVLKLPNPNFTPEAAIIWRGSIAGSPSLNGFLKAIGQADLARLNFMGGTTSITPGFTFGTGEVTLGSAFANGSYSQCPMTLMRRSDGNGDTNEGAVMDCGTYIGDGTATRTFTVGSTGRRPLFAFIAPSNTGAGAFRDPGHLTNTSQISSGGTSTLHITAGIPDGFTVGSSLNVNAIEYVWFVLWGTTAAGNGGWSQDTEISPVEPDMPADGDGAIPDPVVYDDPVVPPVVLPGEPDLTTTPVILTPGDDIGGQIGGSPCETYTRGIVNIALSHLEISKVVGNLTTEASEAASLARRHVKQDVNTTLRDFPWDFATRYASLVLVAGSETVPVNNDWIYSYRAPQSMMLARRIAKVEKGRKFDDDPITFRLGQDASGLLVYCNSLATATVPLVLEYTYRNECPAFWGDALFREALSWRIAASLSPLARDPKKKEFCLGMYYQTLERARTVDAKEQQQEPNGDADWISGRN